MAWSSKGSNPSSEVDPSWKWSRINQDQESLDNPAICAVNPGGGPIWMRDCLRKWFCLELLRKMIARTISKASTNQTNNQPTNQINQPIEPIIDRSRSTNQVIKNTSSARPAILTKAKTNQKAIDQMITITANIADDIGWGPELARGLDHWLEVSNWSWTRSQPRKPHTWEVNIGR